MSQIDDLDKNLNQAHDLISRLKGTVHALGMNKDFANVMEMVRRQEQTIQELREEIQRLGDANKRLCNERDEFESKWRWHFYDEELEPEAIRDFLVDIGIEPAQISKMSLGDRMDLWEAIQTLKV